MLAVEISMGDFIFGFFSAGKLGIQNEDIIFIDLHVVTIDTWCTI